MKIPKNLEKYLTKKNLIIVLVVLLSGFLLYKLYQFGIAYIMGMIKDRITSGVGKLIPGR